MLWNGRKTSEGRKRKRVFEEWVQGREKFLSSEQILQNLKVVMRRRSCYIVQMLKQKCSTAYRKIFSDLSDIILWILSPLKELLTNGIHIIFTMAGAQSSDPSLVCLKIDICEALDFTLSLYGFGKTVKSSTESKELHPYWTILHITIYVECLRPMQEVALHREMRIKGVWRRFGW